MGRPINKRYTGEFSGERTGIRVWAYNPNTSTEEMCYIKLQKGSTRYNVVDSEDRVFKITLVDKDFEGDLDVNEGVVKGIFLDGNGDPDSGDDSSFENSISIKKIYNRTCRDFDGNRYDWRLAEAGNRDVIILTLLD